MSMFEKYPIYMNVFEMNILINVISRLDEKEREALRNVLKQLVEYHSKPHKITPYLPLIAFKDYTQMEGYKRWLEGLCLDGDADED